MISMMQRIRPLVVCLACIAATALPGGAGAQSDDDSGAASAPPNRGSDVFDDTGTNDQTGPPRRRADDEPAGADETGRETQSDQWDPGTAGAEQAGDEGPETVAEAEKQRVPVPDKAAQAAALKLVKEVFAEEYQKKSPADKLALAAQLLQQAGDAGNDDATRYVMLRESRDIAAAGGEVHTALSAVDQIAAGFEGVDAIALKLEALTAASRKVADPAQAAAVVAGYIDVSADSLKAGDLDRAIKVVGQADPIARKAKNADVTTRLNQRKKDLKELLGQFGAALGPAKQKLAAAPNDPSANLTVGKFYCFAAGDWAVGLPMLVKGSDNVLRKAAKADLAGAAAPAVAKAGLGDAWWDLGEKQTGLSKHRARERAAYWYESAVDELEGLHRTRVEKRLASMEPADGSAAPAAAPTDKAKGLLENLVRNLPANVRPRKGQTWDTYRVGRWLTQRTRATPFDAVLKVDSINASRFNGRDSVNASFERVGPVELDGVKYRMRVNLYAQGEAPPDIMSQFKRGTHVRVRGLVRSMSASSSGGNGLDIQNVEFFIELARPNLTIVKPPAAAATTVGGGGGGGGAAASPQRVLDTLARKMRDDGRPVRLDDWQADSSNEWLDQQFSGKPIDVVAKVKDVVQTPVTNADYTAYNVYLEPVGPVPVGEVACFLWVQLYGNDDARLTNLTEGMTVRVRGVTRNVRASQSTRTNGKQTVTFSLYLEDDYTVTPAADSKRAKR